MYFFLESLVFVCPVAKTAAVMLEHHKGGSTHRGANTRLSKNTIHYEPDSEAAEMAIKLRRLTGTVVSRRGVYAKAPPEAIREFLNAR
jgi:hypothetical protein